MKLKASIPRLLIISFLFSFSYFPVANADNVSDLAAESQNPVADLMSLPFQNNTNFGYGPLDNTQNVLNIQPVVPIHLNSEWNLITRTILPVIYQPSLAPNMNSTTGLGDLNPTLFFSPAKPGKLIWGVGPTFLFPTGTNNELSQRKVGVGPSLVMLMMPNPWVIGFLVNNIWSIAGEEDRPSVNQMTLQYFINYNLPKGWFVVSSPIITANWLADSDNRWVVPFGAGLGKLIKIGKQPINLSLQGFYNVIRPDILGPKWTLRANVQFLFPL